MGKRISKYLQKLKFKGFTIMLVPNTQGNVKSICVPFFAVFGILLLIAFNIYFLLAYPMRISKIHELDKKIQDREKKIAVLKRDLAKIEPFLTRTEKMTDQINQHNQMAAEIRKYYHTVRNKVARRGEVSRNFRPVKYIPPSRTYEPSEKSEKTSLELLNENLRFLEEKATITGEELHQLLHELKEFDREYDHTPTIWPTKGRITSGFGSRIHPIKKTVIHHSGIDINVREGTLVRAAAAGIVEFAGYRRGYGYSVIIDHGYGLKTLYAHNSKLLVNAGDKVQKSSVISYSGNTGTSTGPHLHYEVWVDGRRVNPISFLGR